MTPLDTVMEPRLGEVRELMKDLFNINSEVAFDRRCLKMNQ